MSGNGLARAHKLTTAAAAVIGVVGSLLAGLVVFGDTRWERQAEAQEVRLLVAEAKAEAKAAAAEAGAAAREARLVAQAAKEMVEQTRVEIKDLQGVILRALETRAQRRRERDR